MQDSNAKSLSELAGEVDGGSQQWVCPRCGGLRWWVINSYFVASDKTRHRKRECRACHQVLYTRESVIRGG